MSPFHNILVAVDFSPTSDDALSTAAELSRTYHAQVHVLHVVANAIPSASTLEPIGCDLGAYLRQSLDHARARLMALVARHQIGPEMLTTAVIPGPPAPEIVRYAEDHAIDLVVLGTHGHGVLDRLLVGSVAERVARHAPCAVLMVRHVTRRLTTFDVEAGAPVVSWERAQASQRAVGLSL
jgi:nucleotide-binding universal stress UspA family protein